MSYVVTGGAGFIGSAFLAKLNAVGINDCIVVDHLGSSEKWKNLNGKKISDYFDKHDFIKRVESGSLPTGIKAIVHMGACSATTELNADYLMQNNFNYSKTLARYSLQHNIRFVYASSAATYGDGSRGYNDDHKLIASLRPLNPYGFSKNLFDLWALENGCLDKICGLRFFNVYGPNEYHKAEMCSVVYKAWRSIKETGVVKLFKSNSPDFKDGEQKRDFIYVKDCAEVIWNAVQNTSANGVFNLGTGKARSWKDLARAVFAALNLPEKIEFIPLPAHLNRQYQNFTEARIEKLLGAKLLSNSSTLEQGVKDYVTSHLEKLDHYL